MNDWQFNSGEVRPAALPLPKPRTISEAEHQHVDHLVASLLAGDFDAFDRDTLLPPHLATPVLRDPENDPRARYYKSRGLSWRPLPPPYEDPGERAHRVRWHKYERRVMFERFAPRIAGVSRVLPGPNAYNHALAVILRARDPADYDVQMHVAVHKGGEEIGFGEAHLSEALTERTVDPGDQAHIDRIVAAVMAVDWEAYRRLTSRSGIDYSFGASRDYFEQFAPKVSGIKHIRCLVRPADRNFSVVLGNREPGGADIDLGLIAWSEGETSHFTAISLMERGFDRRPIESAAHERSRRQWEAREAEEAAARVQRLRAAKNAQRIPPTATDEEILDVLRRWNDTMAAGDYQAALDMVISRQGWTRGEQLRDRIVAVDTRDHRLVPHRVTPFYTARHLRPPFGEWMRGFPWPKHAVYRRDGKVTAIFTPPLDGFWAPLYIEFELVADDDGMWVLEANFPPM